jgi:hypothetical protein
MAKMNLQDKEFRGKDSPTRHAKKSNARRWEAVLLL